MGLVMSPGSVISQLDSMNENLQQAVLNAKTMRLNIDNFLDTGDSLVGKAYDSTRKYFRELHIPTIDAMCQCAEAMIQENNAYKGCISSYLAGIGYVDEDALVKDIEFLDNMISHAQNSSFVPMPAKMALISSLEHAKAPIKKKLKAIQGFKGASSGLYGGIPAYIALAQSGIDEMGKKDVKGVSFNFPGIKSLAEKIQERAVDIKKEAEEGTIDEKLEAGKKTLINYLNAHGITNPVEQQVIIDLLINGERQYWLTSLYITDCKSGADANIIFEYIIEYYEKNKDQITLSEISEMFKTDIKANQYETVCDYLEYLVDLEYICLAEYDQFLSGMQEDSSLSKGEKDKIYYFMLDRIKLIEELSTSQIMDNGIKDEGWTRAQIMCALQIEAELKALNLELDPDHQYDEQFISGLIGNMKNEGVHGTIEGVNETGKPYWEHINNCIDYQEKYDPYNIMQVDLVQLYVDMIWKREKGGCSDKGIHYFGIGAIQWTDSGEMRATDLLDFYIKEAGYDGMESAEFQSLVTSYQNGESYEMIYLTKNQVISAEINMLVGELQSNYNNVRSSYIDDTSRLNNTAQQNVLLAEQKIEDKYIIPDSESHPKRVAASLRWYEVRYEDD